MTAATTAEEWLAELDATPDHVADLLADLRAFVSDRVRSVVEQQAAGEPVIPVVDMDDVVRSTVSEAQRRAIRHAGCLVVRGTFERAEAEAWDAELTAYLTTNAFRERLLGRDPGAATASRIWPVYWSRPQVLARQHHRMAGLRSFLNRLWEHEGQGRRWFEPDRDIGYPDRIRRREPGAVAKGLPTHVDSPAAGGWRYRENQLVFATLITGGLAAYDPFCAAHRTVGAVESPVGSTVFRTFQGWTALSEMRPDDGVLQVVPIPAAAGYRLVVGLAGELGLSGEQPAPAPVRDAGDELLRAAAVPIPSVAPGDTVWWHGDVYHSVGAASNTSRWGNVMYIGSAPRCARNDDYAASAYARFVAGRSPVDYPADDFEVDFVGRATPDDLDPIGRDQFRTS